MPFRMEIKLLDKSTKTKKKAHWKSINNIYNNNNNDDIHVCNNSNDDDDACISNLLF